MELKQKVLPELAEAKKNVHTARLQIALVYFVVAFGQVVFFIFTYYPIQFDYSYVAFLRNSSFPQTFLGINLSPLPLPVYGSGRCMNYEENSTTFCV